MRWKFWTTLALVILVLIGGLLYRGQATPETTSQFPRPVGYVNDFGQLLTDDEERILTNLAAAFEQRTTAQLAVVTVETLRPFDSIESYATNLFNAWGLGRKDKNNGVMLLIAVNERKVRIEVGYGLEQTLLDATCKKILQTRVTPYLREGAYFQAAKNGMESIIAGIENPNQPLDKKHLPQ